MPADFVRAGRGPPAWPGPVVSPGRCTLAVPANTRRRIWSKHGRGWSGGREAVVKIAGSDRVRLSSCDPPAATAQRAPVFQSGPQLPRQLVRACRGAPFWRLMRGARGVRSVGYGGAHRIQSMNLGGRTGLRAGGRLDSRTARRAAQKKATGGKVGFDLVTNGIQSYGFCQLG